MIGRTNTGGGGLIDTDAILRVSAPAGSVVTITKGGVTKSDHGHENAEDHTLYDYYFIIHQSQFDSQNAWTVTATLNGDTATDTIIISSSDEYDVVLSYMLYLFKDGETFDTVTGGWSASGWSSVNAGSISDNVIKVQGSGGGGNPGLLATANAIDVTSYSTLVFKGNLTGIYVSGSTRKGIEKTGLYSSKSASANGATFDKADETGTFTQTVDISAVTGSFYVACRTANPTSSSATFSEIYLLP